MRDQDFESLQDVKDYAEKTGNYELRDAIDAVVDCVYEVDGGYEIAGLSERRMPMPQHMASAFKYGVLVGTFLEDEYPRPEDYPNHE